MIITLLQMEKLRPRKERYMLGMSRSNFFAVEKSMLVIIQL